MPATLDLEIYIGLDFGPITITCKDAEGAALDLTGSSFFAEGRKEPGSAVLVDLNPQVSDDPTTGVVTLSLDRTTTAALAPGGLKWDLIWQTAEGLRLPPLVAGSLKLKQSITLPA